jgi:hypothetical protein
VVLILGELDRALRVPESFGDRWNQLKLAAGIEVPEASRAIAVNRDEAAPIRAQIQAPARKELVARLSRL